jgi:hypothetical protein
MAYIGMLGYVVGVPVLAVGGLPATRLAWSVVLAGLTWLAFMATTGSRIDRDYERFVATARTWNIEYNARVAELRDSATAVDGLTTSIIDHWRAITEKIVSRAASYWRAIAQFSTRAKDAQRPISTVRLLTKTLLTGHAPPSHLEVGQHFGEAFAA